MGIESLDFLRELSTRRTLGAPTSFKRFLYDKIDWDNRLISIKGARGAGKTTLVLQHLRENIPDPEQALYVSLDHLWFSNHSLYDVADFHRLHGGTHLFVDEIHYQKGWQQLVKNLYDDFPSLHFVYTGSSLLRLETSGADLSRRQVSYALPGLSFREYLALEKGFTHAPVQMADLLEHHAEIAAGIVAEVEVFPAFYTYLESGYYPFYKESASSYLQRLEQTVVQVLESDLPAVEDVSYSTIRKTRKMLAILAASAPQTPNMSKLYAELETDRNQGMKMLGMLERAELLNLLSSKSETLKNMSRPDKLYCANTNLMAAFVEQPNIGCKRETFFVNQLRAAGYGVKYPPAGDFLVDGKWLFEVGGKNKGFDQIAGIPSSFLAIDDIEVGWGNRIPLWMFGLLY